MNQDAQLLLGTTKGVFISSPTNAAADWQVSGPHCDAAPLNRIIGDPATGMIRAASGLAPSNS